MELGNYKINVKTEAESKAAQELFFELGYYWRTGLGVKHLDAKFLFVKNNKITMGFCSYNFSDSDSCELTITQLRDLVAQSKPKEQGLISGKEALIALANGEDVECRAYEHNWINVDNKHHHLSLFFDDSFQFRLKPCTITLNIEIPAPFKPKEKDLYWHISPEYTNGYGESMYNDGNVDTWQQFGAWRTKEEIKQVVAALRGALKNG